MNNFVSDYAKCSKDFFILEIKLDFMQYVMVE